MIRTYPTGRGEESCRNRFVVIDRQSLNALIYSRSERRPGPSSRRAGRVVIIRTADSEHARDYQKAGRGDNGEPRKVHMVHPAAKVRRNKCFPFETELCHIHNRQFCPGRQSYIVVFHHTPSIGTWGDRIGN